MIRVLILLCLLGSLNALKCKCDKSKCPQINASDCPAGITLDACRCCDVCAKAEGEECGGPYNMRGKCGIGLNCQKPNTNDYAEWLRLQGICVLERDYVAPSFD
uniref:Androcin n=1 Tax=Androctonus bicolor TaxID=748906 RepID=A0A1S5MU63_9SCOR|nr:androcin [Androctonus bicolor]AGV98854.1 androcin [Androctonus bicolor]